MPPFQVIVNLGAIVTKGESAFPKASTLLEPHNQIVNVISRTLIGGFLPSAQMKLANTRLRQNILIHLVYIFLCFYQLLHMRRMWHKPNNFKMRLTGFNSVFFLLGWLPNKRRKNPVCLTKGRIIWIHTFPKSICAVWNREHFIENSKSLVGWLVLIAYQPL